MAVPVDGVEHFADHVPGWRARRRVQLETAAQRVDPRLLFDGGGDDSGEAIASRERHHLEHPEGDPLRMAAIRALADLNAGKPVELDLRRSAREPEAGDVLGRMAEAGITRVRIDAGDRVEIIE